MKALHWIMSLVLALCLVASVVFEYLFSWKNDVASDSALILGFILAIVCVIAITVIILFFKENEKKVRMEKIKKLTETIEKLENMQNSNRQNLPVAQYDAEAFKSYANAMADI